VVLLISVLLVVDGTPVLENIRSILLNVSEIRLDVAHSTKEALDKALSRRHDLVISYAYIPRISGIEFLPELTGIEMLQSLRRQGINLPFILYIKNLHEDLLFMDVNNVGEFRKGNDVRKGTPALLHMVKQAVVRKKAENDLKLRNTFLNDVLSVTPLALCTIESGKITWGNSRFSDLVGTGVSSLPGTNFEEIFCDKSDYLTIKSYFDGRASDEKFYELSSFISNINGNRTFCSVSVRRIDLKDPLRGDIVIFEDKSEEQKLKNALRVLELRNQELVDSSSSLIVKTDSEGTILFINRSAEIFFKSDPREILGKPIVGTLITENSRSEKDFSVLINGVDLFPDETAIHIYEHPLGDNYYANVAWTAKSIKNEKGRLTELLLIGQDITDHENKGELRLRIPWIYKLVEDSDVSENVFESVFLICQQIAREGREGKTIGTSFIIGDSEAVMEHSRQCGLNALEGHPIDKRMVTNPLNRENIKNLAQLDGAFVVQGDGFAVASCRHLVPNQSTLLIPEGLGTRHSSVAGITQITRAIGVVVSQSGGTISVFKAGRIEKTIKF